MDQPASPPTHKSAAGRCQRMKPISRGIRREMYAFFGRTSTPSSKEDAHDPACFSGSRPGWAARLPRLQRRRVPPRRGEHGFGRAGSDRCSRRLGGWSILGRSHRGHPVRRRRGVRGNERGSWGRRGRRDAADRAGPGRIGRHCTRQRRGNGRWRLDADWGHGVVVCRIVGSVSGRLEQRRRLRDGRDADQRRAGDL